MGSRRDKLQRSESLWLVDRVVGRLRLAALGRSWLGVIAWLGSSCFALMLVQRLGGFGADWATVEALLALPVCAALLAALIARQPTVVEAARKIDSHCETGELFLTLVQLDSSAGAYQSVILEQAELRASQVVPSSVVPWNWLQPSVRLCAGACLLVSTDLFLPQFDPFGTVDSASAAVAVRRDLQDSRRETANRLAELYSNHESTESSSEFDQALSEVAAELRQLTAGRPASDLKELDARQREIEARWREARSGDEVSRVLEQAQTTQFFGASDQSSRQWVEELAEGQTQSIDEAFDSLSSDLERLDSVSVGAQRQELAKKIREAMAELQRFAGNQLQSQPMEAAMKRAMSQLDSSRLDPGLQLESTEASKDSLELAQAELREIANDASQLASLEKALNAIQSAKQLAQQSSPATSGKNEATIQEFVEQYADLQGAAGKGQPGNDPLSNAESQEGTPGQQVASSGGQSDSDLPGKAGSAKSGGTANASEGGSAEHGPGRTAARENERAETGFRDTREAAVLQASRRLMAMRRQGLSDAGESSQEYRELVRSLQKRVSTAIEVEEIPPGYVSGIRSYFDSLEQPVGEDLAASGETEKPGVSIPAGDSSEATDDAP